MSMQVQSASCVDDGVVKPHIPAAVPCWNIGLTISSTYTDRCVKLGAGAGLRRPRHHGHQHQRGSTLLAVPGCEGGLRKYSRVIATQNLENANMSNFMWFCQGSFSIGQRRWGVTFRTQVLLRLDARTP